MIFLARFVQYEGSVAFISGRVVSRFLTLANLERLIPFPWADLGLKIVLLAWVGFVLQHYLYLL